MMPRGHKATMMSQKISVCLLECITLDYTENVGSTTNIILITSTLIRILLMGL